VTAPALLPLQAPAAPVTLLDDPLAGPPAWLPFWAEGLWLLLGTYPFLLSLVVALVGIVLAIFARAFIRYWGLKLTARTSTEVDDKLVRLVAGVAGLLVAYLALVAAVQALPVGETAITIGTRLLVSLLVLHLTRAALKASDIGLLLLSQFQDRYSIIEERTIPLFDLMATVIIVAIAVYALFVVWNIDPTAWLASAGVVGIAVGFAARDTLANLFAGFFIIADAPYKMGDYVVLDNGERGEITKVGIRSTRLLTRDDVEIIIPNSEMANTKVVNESGGRWIKYRIRIKVGVAYSSDVDQVVDLLEGIAREHDGVCRHPQPRVRMRGYGDSSLDFELLCWVNHPSERGLVSHQLYMEIFKALGREDIEIPFPQRDLWVRRVPSVELLPEPGAASGQGDAPPNETET
jgi:MscS family membrane protein